MIIGVKISHHIPQRWLNLPSPVKHTHDLMILEVLEPQTLLIDIH
jgi:hypothetical protein